MELDEVDGEGKKQSLRDLGVDIQVFLPLGVFVVLSEQDFQEDHVGDQVARERNEEIADDDAFRAFPVVLDEGLD